MPTSIAEAFVDARSTGAVIVTFPGAVPAALDVAYDIQDTAIALTGQTVGGWKVGRIPAPLVETYRSDRLAGPIFAERIVESVDGAAPAVSVLAGFAAIEAELLMRVGRAPPPALTLEDVPDYIDEVRFGLEVASSPFPGINDLGPTVTVADFGNNFGLVLGPRIIDWRSRDLINARAALSIDGKVVGSATSASMLDGPFGAIAFLTALLAGRGRSLTPGTWISTGAITGVHPVRAGQLVTAQFDDALAVACRIASFVPPTPNGGRP